MMTITLKEGRRSNSTFHFSPFFYSNRATPQTEHRSSVSSLWHVHVGHATNGVCPCLGISMYPPSTSTRSTTDDDPGVGRRLGEGGGLLRSAESAVPANPRSGPWDGFGVRTSVNSWVSSSKASSVALEADAFPTCECLITINNKQKIRLLLFPHLRYFIGIFTYKYCGRYKGNATCRIFDYVFIP